MKHWNYKGVADITIGEAQENKAPKVILIVLIIVLSTLAGLAIYFRDYLRDMAITPEIILSTHEVSVELGSEFNAETYIISKGDEYSITGDTVDTNVLNAEYTVIYTTWNKVNSSSTELKVKVVDDTAPTINLKSNNRKIKLDENGGFTLILGKSTDTTLGTKDFNAAKDILVEVTDNHTSEEDLLATLKITPNKPDFTLDENEFSKNITINYEIKDEVGLTASKNIIVTVINGVVEIPQSSTSSSTSTSTSSSSTSSTSSTSTSSIPISSSKPPVSSSKPKPQSSSSTYSKPYSSSSTYSKPHSSSYTPPYSKPTSSSTPPVPSGAFINGVHDITVKEGTGLQTIVSQLLEGVYGSGYVTMEYRKVNPTVAGVYTVTFSSSDGVTETCTVTVIP